MSQSGQDELEALRGEVERLESRLAGERSARALRLRRLLSGGLSVLAVIALTLALVAVWTFRTLTVTDLFVDRVGSVIEEPAVAEAVGQLAAAEVIEALDLESRLRDRLPEQIAPAAGPIASAAENALAQGATTLAQTDALRAAWDIALASGHRITIGVLSGTDTTVLENDDGVIVLDITPVVNALIAQGSSSLSELLGRDIDAPTVSADTVDEAVAALEDRLDTDLPDDFGQVVLVSSDNLATAQATYQTVRTAVWLAPIAAAVLVGLAIAASTRRLRTTLGIVVGTGLLLLLVGLTLDPVKSAIVGSVDNDGLAGAVAAGFDSVFSTLEAGIVLVVVLAVIAALVLFLTGGSAVAASGRQLAGQTPSLAAAHRGWFLGGGALVALLLLAVIPGRSWGQLGLVVVLYAAYALAVLLAPRPSHVDSAP